MVGGRAPDCIDPSTTTIHWAGTALPNFFTMIGPDKTKLKKERIVNKLGKIKINKNHFLNCLFVNK